MSKNEAIVKTMRHLLGIIRVWIVYFGLSSEFPGFIMTKKD